MRLSSWVMEAARAAWNEHPGDLPKANEMAERLIRAHPNLKAEIDNFIRGGAQNAVYEVRKQAKRAIRQGKELPKAFQEAETVCPFESVPEVVPIDTLGSKAVQSIYRRYYDYPMCKTRLGAIRKGQIDGLAEIMDHEIDGKSRERKILMACKRLLKRDDQSIDEIPGKKLKAVFDKNRIFDDDRGEGGAVAV